MKKTTKDFSIGEMEHIKMYFDLLEKCDAIHDEIRIIRENFPEITEYINIVEKVYMTSVFTNKKEKEDGKL